MSFNDPTSPKSFADKIFKDIDGMLVTEQDAVDITEYILELLRDREARPGPGYQGSYEYYQRAIKSLYE
jgi:hypothetical protein